MIRQFSARALVGAVVFAVACSTDAPVAGLRATVEHRAALTTISPAKSNDVYREMSTMGAIAAGVAPLPDPESAGGLISPLPGISPSVLGSADAVVHSPTAIGTQAETSIAANADGSVMIAGYNDARGFNVTPTSLSGVARSLNHGLTWAEVLVGPSGSGTLPTVAGGSVFGDPDVKFDPTRNIFIYSSIYVRPSDNLQGLSIHYSNADGSTWTGPVQVTPSFITGAAADKEFIDVNPVTGRIHLTWTNFGTSVSILTSFSDDLGTTWSPAATLMTAPAGRGVQGSMPRVLPGTGNANSSVYAVWRVTGTTRNIGCARSTNGGASWEAAVLIDSEYANEDQIVGVDRVNTSPSMAVDPTTGRVYVVYQRNNATGEGDVALRSFVGACQVGSAVLLNSNPGADRAQFYPFVAVDRTSGRVEVGYYDQTSASGDVIEMMHTSSTDQGVTWSPPTPLSDRAFHAGYGNDTSQPNLGDYNQGVALNGTLATLFSMTALAPRFDEGQPSSQMITPDVVFDSTAAGAPTVPLRVQAVTVSDAAFCASGSNGKADPGETVELSVSLTNYVGNAVTGAATLSGISATLSTGTSGVSVQRGQATYGSLAPLASGTPAVPFAITLAPSFVPGTPVDFVLDVTAAQGTTQLVFRMATGTAGAPSNVINEDFTSTTITVSQTPPTNVWASVRGGSITTNPAWVVSQALTAGNNAAFHTESGSYAFVRLFSPVVTLPSPAGQSTVTLDFDLSYNLEIEPAQNVLAYDGLTLRITDQTSGATLRSVLAEAFAEEIRTGSSLHFPKHLPRDNTTTYFQDMSVWSGNSAGPVHVSMRFAGAGLVGRSIQLRFEYAEDASGVCATGTCGVAVDNVVLNVVPQISATCTPAAAVCGNGIVEAGEQCESGACCAGCQFAQATVSCRAPSGTCDVEEFCTGTAATCPSDASSPNGTSCNDGNACTQGDTCQAGACTGGTPVTCTASDQCHTAGTCNPSTGICTDPAATNGTSCNDGDACTQTDTCQAGSCTGGNAVTCTASDQCHTAGTCNPSTGVCTNPAANDGTSCNDGDACTRTDTCQAGSCTGGNPVTCTASDQCHAAGTCDVSTGVCTNPAAPNGTTCNDGNACTQTDTCQAGACTGGNAITCTASDQCHVAGVCDPGSGTCSNPAQADGTSCSDGNACTQTDTCQAGACTGANPVACVAADQCHEAGTCDGSTGQCSSPVKADGATCDDSNGCTQTDTCQAGTCAGSNPVVCTASDQCHDVGTCDGSTGTCTNPAKANGTACNDANACTQSDSCQAGVCTGAQPIQCMAADQCHAAGLCNPATGVCSTPAQPDGTTCNDANACTQKDTCQAGACVGANPVSCEATVCHTGGTCDATTGACTNPVAPDGTECPSGTCAGGECVPSPKGGCGCTTVEPFSALAMVGVLAALSARRRRAR